MACTVPLEYNVDRSEAASHIVIDHVDVKSEFKGGNSDFFREEKRTNVLNYFGERGNKLISNFRGTRH